MARRSGMMTALQAALAGFSGGIEGRMQQRAADEEKSRVAAALARQQGQDAMAMEDRTMAMEDREQAKQDRLQSQRVAFLKAGYVPDGLDMPGATPRTPVSSEMVGGQRFSMYETPQQMSRRVAIEEATLKARMKPKDELTEWERQQVKDKAADRASRERIASGRASKGASGAAGGMKPQTATDATKEGQGLKFLKDNASNQEVMLVLQKAFEENPALADRPGLIGYGLMQQAERKARVDASASKPKTSGRAPISGNAPPGRGGPASSADPLDEAFDRYTKK